MKTITMTLTAKTFRHICTLGLILINRLTFLANDCVIYALFIENIIDFLSMRPLKAFEKKTLENKRLTKLPSC